MELNDLLRLGADQDAGHLFDLVDPVRGDATGIKVRLAGPDSERARKARFDMDREIGRLSARKGGLTPEQRETVAIDFLFALTLGWEIGEGGKALPLTRENFGRLCKAGTWVRGQIDHYAGERAPYFGEPTELGV